MTVAQEDTPGNGFVDSSSPVGTVETGTFNRPDGRTNWVRPIAGDVSLVSASPNGTLYVYANVPPSGEVTFAEGTPQETTIGPPGALACYGSTGDFQWAVAAGGAGQLAALAEGCVVISAYGTLIHYGSNGTTAWTRAVSNQDSMPSVSAIPGTNQFIAATLSDGLYMIRKYNAPTNTSVWTKFVFNPRPHGAVHARVDGSGLFLIRDVLNDYHLIAYFTPNGTMYGPTAMNFAPADAYIAPIPLSFTGFYACGVFNEELVLGEGQPNETSLTPSGEEDVFLGRFYLDEQNQNLSITVIGHGNVSVDPPGCSYPYGTEVTLRAAPSWPEHDAFAEWQGDLTGADPETVLTMDGHKSVTAVFEELPGAPPLPALSIVGLTALAAAIMTVGPRKQQR